jgi:DNA-binding transcriptional LysR family regulator
MPRGTGLRTVFDEACAAAGVHPPIALEASAPEAIADLTVRGLGVAILSESMAAGVEDLHALQLADVRAFASLALIWRDPEGPALHAFLARAREAFAPPEAA